MAHDAHTVHLSIEYCQKMRKTIFKCNITQVWSGSNGPYYACLDFSPIEQKKGHFFHKNEKNRKI